MADIDIEAIRKLCNLATPGPWQWHAYGQHDDWIHGIQDPGTANEWPDAAVALIGWNLTGAVREANAALIAQSRTLIPALCSEVEAARLVIGTLDTTADGGSPMPGDTIYYVRLVDPNLLSDERTVQSGVIAERHADHLILKGGGWLHITDAYVDSIEAAAQENPHA